jgi:heavy metal sensor kinase
VTLRAREWWTRRSLRFRLTLSYVVFFTLLLGVLGVVFNLTLTYTLDGRMREILDEEWGAVKGYIKVEDGQPSWFYDSDDPEEELIVDRLRRILLFADSDGKVLEVAPGYVPLGVDPPEAIRAALRSGQVSYTIREWLNGEKVMVRSGVLKSGGRTFYLAVGRRLADNQTIPDEFTWNYFAILPVVILATSLLGWFMASRALQPLEEVAGAAQKVSHSNLSLRVPTRGSDDELDRLITTVNSMVERLEQSFEQISRFSTDVSHELRTPLTAIRGQLEVALFTAKSPEQYREAILNALQDVERLSQIVRALLLLSQAESGQLTLQKTAVNLTALVHDVVDQFQIPAEEAGIRLRADLPDECPVEVDRVQMERLISNLLSNAVKYTGQGGQVRVRLDRAPGGVIELTVEDTGEGIATHHLPYIFDRFYRVHPADPSPEKGLGLGLSFVAWIAKAHGGSVDVRSEEGKGSRFIVRLPEGKVAAPFAEAPELARKTAIE